MASEDQSPPRIGGAADRASSGGPLPPLPSGRIVVLVLLSAVMIVSIVVTKSNDGVRYLAVVALAALGVVLYPRR